jgi:phosphoserine phosphatase
MTLKSYLSSVGYVCLLSLIAACAGPNGDVDDYSLPSWQEGVAKLAITDFVGRVVDPDHADFVAPADRIAVFDNDGTLIIERPTLVQFEFLYSRIKSLAGDHPDWQTTQPFQAVLEDDRELLMEMGFRQRTPLVAAAQAGISQDEFQHAATEFLEDGQHVRYSARYVDLVYQPMLELIGYLQAHEFKVFIVSGGGIEFIRSYAERAYGVPKENVIGSSMKAELKAQGDRLDVYRKPGFGSMNAGRFKPINIRLHTGRRPVFAIGNSDGDLEMLQYANSNALPSLVMLINHDDAAREYEYPDESIRVREIAADRGWPIVSMRDDFRTVFSVEAP